MVVCRGIAGDGHSKERSDPLPCKPAVIGACLVL